MVNGYISIIEFGYDSIETTVKRCDAKACAWETLHLFNEVCRGKACNVAAGSYLYIHCLGWEIWHCTLACGKFKQMWGNHRHAGWKKRCFWRSYSRVIYVAGGLRNGEKLETCEMYDATANEWQLITRLNVPHYHGCMVCLNGKLFVLCGRNERN